MTTDDVFEYLICVRLCAKLLSIISFNSQKNFMKKIFPLRDNSTCLVKVQIKNKEIMNHQKKKKKSGYQLTLADRALVWWGAGCVESR